MVTRLEEFSMVTRLYDTRDDRVVRFHLLQMHWSVPLWPEVSKYGVATVPFRCSLIPLFTDPLDAQLLLFRRKSAVVVPPALTGNFNDVFAGSLYVSGTSCSVS